METSIVRSVLLAVGVAVCGVGCKSMTLAKARSRSSQMTAQMTIDEVYRLLGQPRETFAGVYVWEYYWPGQGPERLLHIEFVERDGHWVVQNWEWR